MDKLPDEVRTKIKYLYYNHPNPGARADTLRQVVLYYQGGVYCDVNDAACLVSLEKFLQKHDYFIALEPVMYANNAVIGSKKKHIISKLMIAWLAFIGKEFVREWKEEYVDADQEDRDDYIVSNSGPIAITQVIFGILMDNPEKLKNSLILPSSWVYPNYWMKESPLEWLKPVSITGHYDRRDFLAK